MYRGQDIWLIAKIFRGYAFDIFHGHGVHLGFQLFVMIEPEPVKLIESGLLAKRIVALVCDLLLSDQFLLGSHQFFFGQTLAGELLDLIKQRRFYRRNLLRISAEIKCEQARDQSLHLARAYVIRQSHFFTNANEKPRAEIAAGFVDEIERVSIRIENVHARDNQP